MCTLILAGLGRKIRRISQICLLNLNSRESQLGFSEIQAELTNIYIFKFYFILEFFKWSTCWAQSDVFGVKSNGVCKIRQIKLLRQGILENLEWCGDVKVNCLVTLYGYVTLKPWNLQWFKLFVVTKPGTTNYTSLPCSKTTTAATEN